MSLEGGGVTKVVPGTVEHWSVGVHDGVYVEIVLLHVNFHSNYGIQATQDNFLKFDEEVVGIGWLDDNRIIV